MYTYSYFLKEFNLGVNVQSSYQGKLQDEKTSDLAIWQRCERSSFRQFSSDLPKTEVHYLLRAV